MDIPFEKVTVKEAKVAQEKHDAVIPAAPEKNWSALRNAKEGEQLKVSKEVMTWLFQLPPEVRPRALAIQYPRIFNKIAELWASPQQCEKYLDELLMDERGTRQGFPQDVATELAVLKTHFNATANIQHFDVWGQRIGDD
ncbi:MAG TPA: hypothetical protein VIF82_17585 [Burkholderiaceae bacterium]|jgi:hypothetical protein